MKALVSPNEKLNSYDGTELGSRVVQVAEEEFEVSPSLFWVDCPDDCIASNVYYADGAIHELPPPPPPPPEVTEPEPEPTQPV